MIVVPETEEDFRELELHDLIRAALAGHPVAEKVLREDHPEIFEDTQEEPNA